jgi:hypothetical protein
MSFWTPVENPETRPPRSRVLAIGFGRLADDLVHGRDLTGIGPGAGPPGNVVGLGIAPLRSLGTQ